jgi:hypothetical protein
MSRSKVLPTIPVKHAVVRKVLAISVPLESKLRAYIAYYAQQQGLQPNQVPSESDTIVALIENFLTRDAGFNRYLRSQAASARPAARKSAPDSSGAPA